MPKQIIVGLGEIGKALQKILQCDGVDKELSEPRKYDVLHVAIPYTGDRFHVDVFNIQYLYSPSLTIIHSTVPLGASRKHNAVHSPIRGIHPHLEQGIRTFVKYFGGDKAEEAAVIFQEGGIKTICTEKQETTEALKLWDTQQYREAILLEKEIHNFCDHYGIDFDLIYSSANKTYNEGYEALGRSEYKKYILKHIDGPIGGHCLEPNNLLLKSHDYWNNRRP